MTIELVVSFSSFYFTYAKPFLLGSDGNNVYYLNRYIFYLANKQNLIILSNRSHDLYPVINTRS